MAQPIAATPAVTGKVAEAIERELLHGTPDTPQRVETIRRADELVKRVKIFGG